MNALKILLCSLVGALGLFASGCVAHCKSDPSDAEFPAKWASCRYRAFKPATAVGREVKVVLPHASTKPAKPVLLLHEIPALSSHVLVLAERLAAQGFTVYVPRLFGNRQGRTGKLAGVETLFELSASRDWNVVLGQHEASAITDWLRKLCRDISNEHEGRPIGVIGMCLTGAFPVALMTEDCVRAPVVCQPSLPLFSFIPGAKASLALSNEELARARAMAKRNRVKVFYTRYAKDRISHPSKLETLRAKLGDRLVEDHTITKEDYERYKLPRNSHATLTHCVETKPAQKLFCEVVAFLDERLVRGSASYRQR